MNMYMSFGSLVTSHAIAFVLGGLVCAYVVWHHGKYKKG